MTAPRDDRTGGQDSDEHLVAQALRKSPRRRGVAPHRAPGDRQIRGKTTLRRSECGSGTPGSARHQHPVVSIAVRVRTPGTPATTVSLSEWWIAPSIGWPCRDRRAAAWRIADSTNRVSFDVEASQPMIAPAMASITNATEANAPVTSLTQGEVRNEELVGRRHGELALDEVRYTLCCGVGYGGADLLLPPDALPAAEPHQPLDGGLGDRDALALQVGPHLQRPVQRLRAAPAALVGFVVAGEDLGDRGVPQGPLRGRARSPRVEGSRGDLDVVLGEHAADRSDPEPVGVLGDELADQRRRGSVSRTKKDVAAFRISMVCSSSAFFRACLKRIVLRRRR